MVMFRTAPGLLLAALAVASSHAEPLRLESRLPAASVSPSLKELANAMPAAQATAAPAHTVVPLRLVTPAMKSRAPQPAAEAAPQATAPGEASASALQAGAGAITPNVYTNGTRVNVEGIVSDNTVAPADPNGAAGATQYV